MSSRYVIGLFAAFLLGTASTQISAAGDPTQFLFRDMSFSSAENNQLFRETINSIDALNFEQADETSEILVANIEADSRVDGLTFARVLTNAAIIHSRLDQIEVALELLERSVSLVDEESVFHKDIYPLMMVKAHILVRQGKLATATDQLRRAQHITHRNDGVYSAQQTDVVDLIADINVAQKNYLEADRQQLFNLKVGENVFGEDSLELVPRLEKAGAYFRRRGIALPYVTSAVFSEAPTITRKDRADIFAESIRLYDRALSIQEVNYGPADLRLVNTLRSLAQTRMAQISGRRYAEDALERVVRIISSDPMTDVAEHAVALIDLADTYTITGNRKAEKTYLAAWDLLSQSPELTNQRDEIFNSVTRISPMAPLYNVIARRPTKAEEGEEIFVDVTYSVRPDGRASDISLLNSNAQVDQKKKVRLWLRDSRFRPRINDGALVLTEGLTFRQTFKVLEQVSDQSADAPSKKGTQPTVLEENES